MRLPRVIRSTVGAVTSRVADLPGVRQAAERAPSAVITSALKSAEFGLAGYGVLRKAAAQATDLVRAGVAAGTAMLDGTPAEPAAAGPTEDPWSGGPLQPVDDILDTVVITGADAAAVEGLPGGETLSHDALPLEDFDHLTIGTLRARIRKLSVGELLQLREYEHAHADRIAVVKMFDNRIAVLAKQSAGAAGPG
ncbi:MAG: hypothetical protein QOG49_1615 [Frankiaceae bacterium]|nr:hypothetical protein [Frankiaceae bacterium]